MRKPDNYYGYAWENAKKGYNKKYLKTKEGKKEIKEIEKSHKKNRIFNKKNGFDPTETWNLDLTISQFVLPRLKYLKKHHNGYPTGLTFKKWNKVLSKIIYSMEQNISENLKIDKKYNDKVQEGFNLFGKYYMNLWD